MFPREESRNRHSTGHMDGPRTSLRDRGLLALFPGLGPRAQLSRTWLALGGSSPVQPQLPGQSQIRASPFPLQSSQAIILSPGGFSQHTVFYIPGPLKPTLTVVCSGPSSNRTTLPSSPRGHHYIALAWPQEQTQASPSSHFQGHLSSPGCPRAVGRSTSARLPPLPYSLLPFLNRNQKRIFPKTLI